MLKKRLFQRRQMLWYLGLGSLGVGTAAFLQHSTDVNTPQIGASPTVSKAPVVNASASSDSSSDKPVGLPEFQGINQWLNSEPLKVSDLKGSVVLIQFWTFACINCQRTLPYVTEWHRQYAAQGLKVIGIHTPEFAFEREVDNIEAALAQHSITYPVPLDNEFTTWRAYNNKYWPHLFLADRQGVVQYDHIGEGAYDTTEQTIRQMLA